MGQKDPLEKEMAPCSSILAWEIPWTKELGGLQSMESLKESDTTERLNSMVPFTGPGAVGTSVYLFGRHS